MGTTLSKCLKESDSIIHTNIYEAIFAIILRHPYFALKAANVILTMHQNRLELIFKLNIITPLKLMVLIITFLISASTISAMKMNYSVKMFHFLTLNNARICDRFFEFNFISEKAFNSYNYMFKQYNSSA